MNKALSLDEQTEVLEGVGDAFTTEEMINKLNNSGYHIVQYIEEEHTKSSDVPIYFGTLHGEIIGKGSIEKTADKTIVHFEIDTSEEGQDNIIDLLKYELIGFAVVVRPAANPASKMLKEKNDEQTG